MTPNYLLDLNVLIALVEPGHSHYERTQEWFNSTGRKNWGICPLTESGFLRVTTNPAYQPGPRPLELAIDVLQILKVQPGYQYWGIEGDDASWINVTAPFASRIFGHQQVTDAYLLGLAIRKKAVLVTFDRRLRHMAGTEFSKHLSVL